MKSPSSVKTFPNAPPPKLGDDQKANASSRGTSGLDTDERDLLSVFCPMLGILALATIGVVLISGQFPWFFLPLVVFVYFASCLPWKRPKQRSALKNE